MARKKPIVPLMLRLPSGLHKTLVHEAAKANRSLNQELVRRLEESFSRQVTDAAAAMLTEARLMAEAHAASLEELRKRELDVMRREQSLAIADLLKTETKK